ncbi:unnamed protein product [Taenia asiatica]|uniref:Amino acid transporter n=1 Tax=Taenia asiatica TaxID=60517 RepID=A0A3P6PWM5_TAEAS|nr:unnamed protein product [Taenia asiatica]
MGRPIDWRRKCFMLFDKNWFIITTVIGVITGFGVGLALQKTNATLLHFDLPGRLNIRILQLTILPLIVANIITVFASLNPRMNKKMSGATVAYISIHSLHLCRPFFTRPVQKNPLHLTLSILQSHRSKQL